jgi:WD40 repeat protein
MFSVTEALDDLGAAYQAGRWPEAPYTARWAVAEPRSERAILGGHGRVTALCAVPSSGGRALLAVASTDGTIRLWDPETGEPVRSVDGPGHAVTAMCPVPLPDGRVLLVTGHADGALRGWDPETGVPLRELAVHPGRVVAACAIPVGGGRVLLASGGGRTARLWDPETGTQILVVGSEKGTVGTTSGSVRGAADSGSVPGGRATITDVCAFPRGDGRYLLAYGNDDGVAQLRDPETGELIRILGAPAPLRPGQQREPVPTRLAVLGGRPPLLAVGLHGQAADLWDPELGRKVSEKLGEQAGRVVGRLGVDPGQAREICVAPGPGGRPLLAVRGRDGAVRLLESPAGGDTRVLYGQVNQADTVCTVPLADGRALLAAGDDDGVVRVWDPQARAEGGESRATRSGTAAACTIPKPGGGMLLATGDDDHAIRLWDPRSGRVVRTLMGHKGRVGAVRPVVGPKNRLLLASGAEDGAVRLWDPADGTSVMGVNSVHGSERVDSQSCVPLTVKGRPLLAAGGRLWDLKSGRLIRTFRGPDGWFRDMRAVHPPGSRTLLATMSDTGTVRLWDPETASQVRALNDPASGTGPLCEVTLDRGRILLAAGGSDGAVRLWDLADGSQPDVLRDQPGEVTALCMMEGPGGPLLAAGSRLGTVTLWDPRQLAATLTVPVHHRVQALAWADGVLCVGLSAGVIALQLGGELS